MSQDSEILSQSAYGMMQRLDLRPKGRRFKNVEVAGLALPVQPPQHSWHLYYRDFIWSLLASCCSGRSVQPPQHSW